MDKWRLGSFALGVVVTTIVLTSFIFLEQASPAQQNAQSPKPAPAMQKVKVSLGTITNEVYFLPIEAAKERGIWARYALDPEFIVGNLTAISVKEHAASSIRIGIRPTLTSLIARSEGAPVKVIAGHIGEASVLKLYVQAGGPIKTVKDLDGRKFGVASIPDHLTYRAALGISGKFGIRPEIISLGHYDLAGSVAALKTGQIDAFLHAEAAALRLVDSGELKILLTGSDIYPKPTVSTVIYANEDLIQENPELVDRFVKAWLEAVKYLKENPSYATDLFIRKTNAPKDLAEKVVAEITWEPRGRGSGQDLVVSVRNIWLWGKEYGGIPSSTWEKVKVEDAVDTRFLP